MKALFLFDGDCDFCIKLANFWQNQTNPQEVEFLSFRNISDDELKKLHPNLTKEMCVSDVQLLYKNQRLPGFFAVRRLMFFSRMFRFIAPLLYLPLVPFFGMFTMYILKRIRSND